MYAVIGYIYVLAYTSLRHCIWLVFEKLTSTVNIGQYILISFEKNEFSFYRTFFRVFAAIWVTESDLYDTIPQGVL